MDSEKRPNRMSEGKPIGNENLFQVRLPPDVAGHLRHFMESRNYNASEAIRTIISRFFKGK
jgi:hypothetical protein